MKGVLYAVTYRYAGQLITRSVLTSWNPARYMVIDRYSDGEEHVIVRQSMEGIRNTFCLSEAVQLLEAVQQ